MKAAKQFHSAQMSKIHVTWLVLTRFVVAEHRRRFVTGKDWRREKNRDSLALPNAECRSSGGHYEVCQP